MEDEKAQLSAINQKNLGKKVFFIATDTAFLPEAYPEAYLAHGYECYTVHNDFSCPLAKKVEILITQFPGSLLFFDTSTQVDGLDWQRYIKQLQAERGTVATIGVFYDKQRSREEKDELKAFFTNVARIKGGVVGLEKGSVKNFERIEKALKKNNAAGRRAAVRAVCDSESAIAFAYQAQTYRGRIIDVSISHFACEIEDSARTIPIYEKLRDASFVINGAHFSADVTLILRRSGAENALCIFMFIKKDGLPGLENEAFSKLSPMLYRIVTGKDNATLRAAFKNTNS